MDSSTNSNLVLTIFDKVIPRELTRFAQDSQICRITKGDAEYWIYI